MVRWQRAGRWLATVDGVYASPAAVRDFALTQKYGRGGGNYPGRFARVERPMDNLLGLANEAICLPAGGVLKPHGSYASTTVFAVPTVPGRRLVPAQKSPHSDGFCDYAAVVYLSRPEHCFGGTAFWRHRSSGMHYFPRDGDQGTERALSDTGLPDARSLTRRILEESRSNLPDGYMCLENEAWELVEIVEMRENRMVIYDANLFHAIHMGSSDWEPDLTRPRLTQNLYLVSADGVVSG